jgi:hypothetical protein
MSDPFPTGPDSDCRPPLSPAADPLAIYRALVAAPSQRSSRPQWAVRLVTEENRLSTSLRDITRLAAQRLAEARHRLAA